MDRVIRHLFVVNWRKAPTTRRIVKYGLMLAVSYGLVFGVIDSELASVGNWLYALSVGATFALLFLGLRRLDRWARQRLRLPN